ncbi:MAG: sodium/proline symporter PutP [Gammaproteobacteria bacterium]|nr:sodium/proline symporter PutP [Gammaproteobacteria bacterium]NIR98864.1 sodium/proline symporter PutP [Gammaproteobacteria bacterium]NIT63985.1 sodium/proline symporter PutP [Gammaproteobacteria bacterium]NIV19145.1 sodium/proline symporter PutP [Gammaproteobacteria bacterium]NIX10314.1 sodium/proline symporter PutP [Gammaproteobacteria bacterium]
MPADQTAVAATFAGYILAMLLIGAAAFRQTRDLSDYILGGRRLGRWVAALSAGASDMSGWLLLGLPGYAYASGFEAAWLAAGLLAGTYVNWRVVAQRLRAYSELAGNALTLPEFLEQRFGDRSRLLRVVSAALILLFFMFYTSSGLVAGGRLFETVFGLPYPWAVAGGAAAVVLYTLFGGFLAVSWTDLAQGLLMAAALLIVPVVAAWEVGGWEATLSHMRAVSPALLSAFSDRQGDTLSALAVISLLGWGLGYFGQPHILARFMAIRGTGQVATARRIAVTWTALTLAGATAVGFAAIAYLEPALTGPDTEKAFMLLVGALFHPVVAGVLLAAILAAIMSTADSQLLVSSSALAEDFYKALWRPAAGPGELVMVGRAAVLVIALLAFALAMDPDSKVLELVAYAWAGFGASFGPTLILALYWPRMTRAGALAGILGGGITVVVWRQLQDGVFELYELVPGFLVSAVAVIAVSLIDRPPSAAVRARHAGLALR